MDLNKLTVDLARIFSPKQFPWLIKKSTDAWINAMTWWRK